MDIASIWGIYDPSNEQIHPHNLTHGRYQINIGNESSITNYSPRLFDMPRGINNVVYLCIASHYWSLDFNCFLCTYWNNRHSWSYFLRENCRYKGISGILNLKIFINFCQFNFVFINEFLLKYIHNVIRYCNFIERKLDLWVVLLNKTLEVGKYFPIFQHKHPSIKTALIQPQMRISRLYLSGRLY